MRVFKDRVLADIPHIGVEIEHGPEGVCAVYVRTSTGKVYETVEADEPDVFCDLDREGNVVGIEMINPGTVHFQKILKKIASKFRVKSLKDFLPEAKKYERVLQTL